MSRPLAIVALLLAACALSGGTLDAQDAPWRTVEHPGFTVSLDRSLGLRGIAVGGRPLFGESGYWYLHRGQWTGFDGWQFDVPQGIQPEETTEGNEQVFRVAGQSDIIRWNEVLRISPSGLLQFRWEFEWLRDWNGHLQVSWTGADPVMDLERRGDRVFVIRTSEGEITGMYEGQLTRISNWQSNLIAQPLVAGEPEYPRGTQGVVDVRLQLPLHGEGALKPPVMPPLTSRIPYERQPNRVLQIGDVGADLSQSGVLSNVRRGGARLLDTAGRIMAWNPCFQPLCDQTRLGLFRRFEPLAAGADGGLSAGGGDLLDWHEELTPREDGTLRFHYSIGGLQKLAEYGGRAFIVWDLPLEAVVERPWHAVLADGREVRGTVPGYRRSRDLDASIADFAAGNTAQVQELAIGTPSGELSFRFRPEQCDVAVWGWQKVAVAPKPGAYDSGRFDCEVLLKLPTSGPLRITQAEPDAEPRAGLCVSAVEGSNILRTGAARRRVPRWDVFELEMELADDYANPFADVTVDAQLTSPSGERRLMPGFYDGGVTWRLRFSPDEVGEWRFRVSVRDVAGTSSAEGAFACTEGRGHGPLRTDPRNTRYLVHADGTRAFLTGYGGWSYATGEIDGTPLEPFRAALDNLARNRSTATRLFLSNRRWDLRDTHGASDLASWDWASPVLTPVRGEYNLAGAQYYDEIIDYARRHGVNVFVAPFSADAVLGGSKYWVENVWSTYCGGPCKTEPAMFTDAAAARLQRRYLRYLIARWGAFDNVIWDLYNEVTCVADVDFADDGPVMKWHRRMARFMRETDAHEHLITTSLTETPKAWWLDEPWYQLVTPHDYATGDLDEELRVDQRLFERYIQPSLFADKPIVFTEFGYREGRDDEVSAAYARVADWTMLCSGGNGIVNGEFILGQEIIRQRRHLMDFLDSLDLTPLQPRHDLAVVQPADQVRVWCLAGNGTFVVYLHHFTSHETPVEGGGLALSDAKPGIYRVRWYDARTGAWLADGRADSEAGKLELTVPTFTTDVVLLTQSL